MRHTFVFLIAIYFSINRVSAQTCYPNGITLVNQTSVDAFVLNNPTCEEIEGFLTIDGSTITDISGLLNLRKVGGFLFIRNCSQLLSLDGLQNIDSIGGGFSILNNLNLNSIDSLYRLKHVGGDFYLQDCNALINLNGLENLSFIGGELFIGDNDLLENMQALAGLQTVQTNIWIEDNPVLQTLQGLENLSSFGGYFRLLRNEGLQSLCNWSNLTEIQEFITVIGNSSLVNFQGLESITSIGGNLRIENNASLQNLNGLNNLGFIDGDLSITNANSLIDLNALSNLSAINGRLSLETNEVLFTLSGLDQINPESMSELTIGFSPNLSMCAVASVCNYLNAATGPAYIRENAMGCDTEFQVRTMCEFLGESKIESYGLSIFPNPTQDFIQIKSDSPLNLVELYDLQGRKLHSILKPQENSIHLSHLDSGIYFLQIFNDNKVISKKLVKH